MAFTNEQKEKMREMCAKITLFTMKYKKELILGTELWHEQQTEEFGKIVMSNPKLKKDLMRKGS